jgi:cytochrome P450
MQAAEEVTYDQFNPYPWYRYMRDTHPVYYDEQMHMWYVFRYEDAQQVLQDNKTFSQALGQSYMGASFLSMDPPLHRKYRTLVGQAFTLRSITQREPHIIDTVNKLIDAVASTGKIDIVTDLSYPLPATLIRELFGIPAADHNYFAHMSDQILDEMEKLSLITEFPAQDEMATYLLPLIQQRRREPTDDLISSLTQAEVDGEKLSDYDIQATCILVLVAGYETTNMLISIATSCFTEHPGVIEDLRAHPDLMPSAIEEVLRYRAPVAGLPRMTAVDTLIGATAVPARSMINVQLASANRDERTFADPDRFNVRRTPNRHIGFGYGIHACLGAPLARLESKIALNTLLARLPGLQRSSDDPVQIAVGPGGFFQGTKHIPMTFVPQTR